MVAKDKKPLVVDNEDALVKAQNSNDPELIDELILNQNGSKISLTMKTDLDNEFTTNEIEIGVQKMAFEESTPLPWKYSGDDSIDMNNQTFNNLVTPTIDSNPATKNYVDNLTSAEHLFSLLEAGDGINIELVNDKVVISSD